MPLLVNGKGMHVHSPATYMPATTIVWRVPRMPSDAPMIRGSRHNTRREGLRFVCRRPSLAGAHLADRDVGSRSHGARRRSTLRLDALQCNLKLSLNNAISCRLRSNLRLVVSQPAAQCDAQPQGAACSRTCCDPQTCLDQVTARVRTCAQQGRLRYGNKPQHFCGWRECDRCALGLSLAVSTWKLPSLLREGVMRTAGGRTRTGAGSCPVSRVVGLEAGWLAREPKAPLGIGLLQAHHFKFLAGSRPGQLILACESATR